MQKSKLWAPTDHEKKLQHRHTQKFAIFQKITAKSGRFFGQKLSCLPPHVQLKTPPPLFRWCWMQISRLYAHIDQENTIYSIHVNQNLPFFMKKWRFLVQN